jgi:hypothetical protein
VCHRTLARRRAPPEIRLLPRGLMVSSWIMNPARLMETSRSVGWNLMGQMGQMYRCKKRAIHQSSSAHIMVRTVQYCISSSMRPLPLLLWPPATKQSTIWGARHTLPYWVLRPCPSIIIVLQQRPQPEPMYPLKST